MLAGIVVAFVSFRYGLHAQQMTENRSVAYAQATLAFGDYKANERIESLLLRKCYEAALTEARELKNLQLRLLFDNLRATENDPELVEYIKIRDPKLLEILLAGPVPEPKPYTTTCP
jgi:CRISPR/Cas system CSM-associated protein Csm2 small subunit